MYWSLAQVATGRRHDFAAAAVTRHEALIRDELNVKAVELIPRDAKLVGYRIKPKLPEVGKRYGKLIPAIREYLAGADCASIAAAVARGEIQEFSIAGQTLSFGPEDLLVETESAEGFACAEEQGFLAGLDTRLSEALIREGVARELIRYVQELRKQAGFEVSDRIELMITGDAAIQSAIAGHRETIMSETLAEAWREPAAGQGLESEGRHADSAFVVRLARLGPAGSA
jgi:isoleucyl-tRNA synthetase